MDSSFDYTISHRYHFPHYFLHNNTRFEFIDETIRKLSGILDSIRFEYAYEKH